MHLGVIVPKIPNNGHEVGWRVQFGCGGCQLRPSSYEPKGLHDGDFARARSI